MERVVVTPSLVPPIDRRSVISLFSRLRTAGGQANPLPLYEELRSMGQIIPAPWGGHLVTSFGLCYQVLRNRAWQVPDLAWRERQGATTRWGADSSREMSRTMPALNPPHHRRVRRSVGNVFDRKSLEILENSVAKTAECLLDQLAEKLREGEADFSEIVSEELPVITFGQWLGLPSADYPLLRLLTHEQVYSQELLPSASQLAQSDVATQRLREYVIALVQERRARPGDDPISAWIRTWDGLEPEQDAADEAVFYLVFLAVLAALDTTSSLISTMVWLLLESPQQMEWLRAHPQYIPAAVEEVLRYDSPSQVISRVAGEDTTLGGVRVFKDQMVHLMVGAANHDPAQYTDPGTFEVRRNATHLSFSGGMHFCLGAPLARLEATVLLSALLRRLPGLRLSRTPEWAPRLAFRRVMTFPVTNS